MEKDLGLRQPLLPSVFVFVQPELVSLCHTHLSEPQCFYLRPFQLRKKGHEAEVLHMFIAFKCLKTLKGQV